MTPLGIRLAQAATVLADVEQAINRRPDAIPVGPRGALLLLTGARTDLQLCIETTLARDAAAAFLDHLEDQVDPETGRVPAGAAEMRFVDARLVGLVAWATLQWALADRVGDFAGRVFCHKGVASNKRQSAQIVPHFVKGATEAPVLVYDHVRDCFGWPIAVSYAIRNHIAHDGGVRNGSSFFASAEAATAPFAVSDAALAAIVERATNEHGVTPSHTRLSPSKPWPWCPDDVRLMLSVCHEELDEALGLLLVSSVATVRTHVGFLMGDL